LQLLNLIPRRPKTQDPLLSLLPITTTTTTFSLRPIPPVQHPSSNPPESCPDHLVNPILALASPPPLFHNTPTFPFNAPLLFLLHLITSLFNIHISCPIHRLLHSSSCLQISQLLVIWPCNPNISPRNPPLQPKPPSPTGANPMIRRGNTLPRLVSSIFCFWVLHESKWLTYSPALTRNNWYKHVNWLNVTLIVGVPVAGCIQAFWTPLFWQTALFAFLYYFLTGLGITAGYHRCEQNPCPFGLPPTDLAQCGHIHRTPPHSLSVSSSLPLVVEQSRVLSVGGLVTTAPIIDTPTPTKTHTPSAKASSTPTSVGC